MELDMTNAKTTPFWTRDDQDVLVAPGLSALVYHNRYPEGKQGGVEIIQHDERILTCGDLRLATTPGQWEALPEIGERQRLDDGAVAATGRFPDADLDYTVRVQPAGRDLRVSVDLATPLPEDLAGQAGFNIEIYPTAYIGKSFSLSGVSHIQAVHRRFPQQDNGPRFVRSASQSGGAIDPATFAPHVDGVLCPAPLASGAHFVAAPEDPLRRFEIVSETGTLVLYDGRQVAQSGWFVLRELIQAGATTDAIVWLITPNAVPDWRRTPVIALSQVGYHPDQVKRAVLELDPRTEVLPEVTLERLGPDGAVTMLTAEPEVWGRFLRYLYAIFDFTEITTPGLYHVRFGGQVVGPFEISPTVYRQEVWQPTLETFFPVQMCHMAVRDRYRLWHGACHLDDALQAPTSHEHFDGYRQTDQTETAYAPGEHIPLLDRGGWHDAGDYDLAAGSQARTTHTLALVGELFGIESDQTTVDWARRTVLLHTPDGVPDIIEQVAHGVENLLGGYRAAAAAGTVEGIVPHSFQGIIANSLRQYVHLGDAATMTDNCVYIGGPGSEATDCDDLSNGRSSLQNRTTALKDDRWAFTNHDTALEYLVAAALAAASRVLRNDMPELAMEALETAQGIWSYEQTHAPVLQPAAYVPRDAAGQEVLAGVELLLATDDARYRDRLAALWPTVAAHPLRVGAAVARALPAIDDSDLTAQLRERVAAAMADYQTALEANPFGIAFEPQIWGIGWQLLSQGVMLYQLWTAFPDLIDPELILRIVNYNLGCHPASNTSLVSGVGAQSATVAYGVNRVDWSYTPGGVISGPALIRPDFPELKEPWPYLWQQTEYVIGGAADYIFCVLAADHMLSELGEDGA
jgi:endoglucanase